LRTTEFLWQEGHTAHETEEEAQAETIKVLSMYKEFVETELAIPVIEGRKSPRGRFPGAKETYAIEALMSDGKAAQMGTSHNLGQHFSKVFDIRFEDREQKQQYAWQTSWGVSTRLIGALVMTHGDDSGLRIPPQVAPIQVVIIPISLGNWKESVLPVALGLEKELLQAGLRVKIDAREEFTPGWKFSEWEMRGVPLRLEVGPKDVKENRVVLVRRDVKSKDFVGLSELSGQVKKALLEAQASLFDQALEFRQANTRSVSSYQEFKDVIESKRGFVRAWWCGDDACEDRIKDETMATIRVLPLTEDGKEEPGACVYCRKKGRELAYFARAY
jgi:prolyl-tRNA synthetase